ncbi:MAG: sulfatase-like hydrolase/transferase [Candidatus Eiseniibacteriota bacterium]|jgi:arylsulfatase A-like enzyme
MSLGMALLAPGCGQRGADETPGALVLVIIDTLRGDRLGCTGYAPAITPVLDSLATRGVLFTRAMTPAPLTLVAVSSLFTGRLPQQHGIRDNGHYVLPADEVTLAERFRAAGWRTDAIVAAAVLGSECALDAGFDRYDDDFSGPYPIYDPTLRPLAETLHGNRLRADRVTDRALARLAEYERAGDSRFFLCVHYFDVHSVYDPPPAYAAMHPGRPYDGEISFVDAQLGRLFTALRDRPDVMVVVVSDHGESQMEHGEPQHGLLLYESTLHVPVIVSGPGVPAGTVRDDPISLVDLEPTLARHFGLRGAPAGATLPPRAGRELDWERPVEPAPLYAETMKTLLSFGWSPLRAVRLGDLKLIRGPEEEYYDLARDPDELRPIDPAAILDRAAGLRAALDALAADDPPQRVVDRASGIDPVRHQALEALGYVTGPPRRETVGDVRELPDPKRHIGEFVQRQLALRDWRLGVYWSDEGEPQRAMALLDSSIALSPSAGAYVARGKLYRQQGAARAARRDFDRSLALMIEENPMVRILRESVAESGRLPAGFEDEALRPAVDYLGSLHLARSEPDSALVYLRWMVDHDTGDGSIDMARSHYNLGLAAYRSGHIEEARQHLEAYLRAAPDDAQAALVRRLIDEKLSGP